MPVVYGNGNRIVQAPGMVVISYEMVHDTRVIYTDGRPHVSPNIRQWLGDSRGRWEGNTLVIETTNFTDQTSIGGGNGNGLRHSADMKMTERFTRIDTDELRYEVHVDDPKTYTQPFTISLPLMSPPGYQLLPYECHEGNYMLPHSLSAEREEDAAIEADRRRGSSASGRASSRTSTPAPGRFRAARTRTTSSSRIRSGPAGVRAARRTSGSTHRLAPAMTSTSHASSSVAAHRVRQRSADQPGHASGSGCSAQLAKNPAIRRHVRPRDGFVIAARSGIDRAVAVVQRADAVAQALDASSGP